MCVREYVCACLLVYVRVCACLIVCACVRACVCMCYELSFGLLQTVFFAGDHNVGPTSCESGIIFLWLAWQCLSGSFGAIDYMPTLVV